MTAIICVECPRCNQMSEVSAPVDGYRRWQEGAFIQDALPDLTADEREILISGICTECWKNIFGEDDE